MEMIQNYTAKYTKVEDGYMGQLIEWPEVVTEGKDIEECREMLKDALKEMILAYQKQKNTHPELFYRAGFNGDKQCQLKELT